MTNKKTNKKLAKLATKLGAEYLPQDANSVSPKNSKAWVAPVLGDKLISDKVIADVDVYDLLESDEVRELAQNSDALALFTSGWGAPISNDDTDEVAPSKHPQRQRVVLLVVANKHGVIATMRKGTDDIIIEEEGRGALADALTELFV